MSNHTSPPPFPDRSAIPDIIASMVKNGLTPSGYRFLWLMCECYHYSTLGELIADALARSEASDAS